MEPTECWIIQSFFPLNFVCPLMSPTLHQSTKRADVRAWLAASFAHVRGWPREATPLPSRHYSSGCHCYDDRGVCGIRGCGVEMVSPRGCTCNPRDSQF